MTAETPIRTKVVEAIYRATDEINRQQPEGKRLEKSERTVLFGQGGTLDSLSLVSLIVASEQELEEAFGVAVTLADERAMAQEQNPFGTIGSLADYAAGLVGEVHANG